MPTSGSTVGFQYINSTPPATYDTNTVYFDNINKNIKVGNIEVANFYTSDDSATTIHVTGGFSWGITALNLAHTFSNFSDYQELVDLAEAGKEIVLIVDSNNARITSYYINNTSGYIYFPINIFDNSHVIGTFVVYPGEGTPLAINYLEPRIPDSKKHFYITITDNSTITDVPGTQNFNNVTLTGGTWNDWRTAISSSYIRDNYDLQVIWSPNNDLTYGERPTFILTDYEINSYEPSFVFKTTLFNGKILEITVVPFMNNTGIVYATTVGKLVIEYNKNGSILPVSATTPTWILAPVTTMTWGDIINNKDNLELFIKDNNSNETIKCNNYYIEKISDNTTVTMVFGPINTYNKTMQVVIQAAPIDNIFNKTVTACQIMYE